VPVPVRVAVPVPYEVKVPVPYEVKVPVPVRVETPVVQESCGCEAQGSVYTPHTTGHIY
jgi:hypothetical protein